MRVLFVFHKVGMFVNFEKVVEYLYGRGHLVTVISGPIGEPEFKPQVTDRVLLAYEAGGKILRGGWTLERNNWRRLVSDMRQIVNYSLYLAPNHPSPRLSPRLVGFMSQPLRKVVRRKEIRWLLSRGMVLQFLKKVERIVPPDRAIKDWLRQHRPDVVVASPYVFHNSFRELEYVKAAQAIKIPTVVAVASWDNLAIKGTFHLTPDLTLVWNETLLREAVDVHGLPQKQILVTGAPKFDYWFEMKPKLDRGVFCRQIGVRPEMPYVVYLCSARGIIADELETVREIVSRLKQNPSTEDVQVLIRPHPLNMINWSQLASEDIRVWPKNGEMPDTPEARQNYYHTLHYCTATIGINTTAMLEAAIADKPCISIIDERHKTAQGDMGHFRHLVNGDFLELAHSYEQAATTLAEVLAGRDRKCENRRRFVKEFIRPLGMNRSASQFVAQVIEAVGQRKPIEAFCLAARVCYEL